MKKLYTLAIIVFTLNAFAQDKLNFDKRFVQSEDKWVAFKPDSLGGYNYGFIYIDAQAGLTFNYEGKFLIDSNGKLIPDAKDKTTSFKVRLSPNNVKVAHIPDSKLNELEVSKTPDWLKYYKEDENSIERLYRWGFMYNGWEECEKGLTYLEKAKTINPDFKGLRVELAYSYNCLHRYQDAIDILNAAYEKEPADAYINKELVYAQSKNGKLDEAEKSCRRAFKNCPDKSYHAENAYNILQQYYIAKDVKKFDKWFKETKDSLLADERFQNLVEQMQTELKTK